MTNQKPARYEEIAQYLEGLLEHASPGDRLPSDAELCERFGVSRMTARQAVQLVAASGRIKRRRGAGTFVVGAPVPRDLGSPLSFTESMKGRGMTSSSKVLERGVAKPTDDEIGALGLESDSSVYVLKRLRLADGAPMAIERVVMPIPLAEALQTDVEDGSLHAAFEGIGRMPTKAHAEVTARRATKEERELLELPASGVVICELRTIFDQSGDPLERTRTCYASDRYTFRAVLVREPPAHR